MDKKYLFVMATSLAVLSLVRALTIDSQLTVIKNDCYERMAIGQRLNPKAVYKTFNYSTVIDCQMACTKEKEVCKAFSFGISAKGNSTCELSHDFVKETADLKPIGTITATDFDLYIKKLGCQVVIEPSTEGFYKPNKPIPEKPDQVYTPSKPLQNGYDNHPASIPQHTVSNHKPGGYFYPHLPPNGYPNDAKPNPDDVHYVQSLVSVASNPNSHLHPIHEIIVGDNSNSDIYGRLDAKGSYGRPNEKYPYMMYGDKYPNYIPNDKYPYGPKDKYPYLPNDKYPYRPNDKDLFHNDRDPYRPHHPMDLVPHRPPAHIPYPNYYYGHSYGEWMRPSQLDGYERPQFNPDRTNLSNSYPYNYNNFPLKPDYNRPDPINERPYPPNERPYPHQPHMGYAYGKPMKGEAFNDIYPDINKRPFRPNYDMDIPRPGIGLDRYDNGPVRRPPHFRPEPYSYQMNYDRYFGNPPRYGSYLPHPDEFAYLYGSQEFDRRYDSDKKVYYNEIPKPLDHTNNPNSNNSGYPNKTPSNLYDKRPDGEKGSQYDKGGLNNNVPGHDKGSEYTKENQDKSKGKPIVTQSVGYDGLKITSIITELKGDSACFRRVLAGKRVSRAFIRRALTCETIEDCQRECADEKFFTCEGFNYRLDPSGRSKGECELLDWPLVRIDIRRDIIPDPDYDYYERDRNAAVRNCKPPIRGNYYGSSGHGIGGSYGGYYGDTGNRRYDLGPSGYGLRRPGDRWGDDDHRPNYAPYFPNRRYDYPPPYPPSGGNRRGDYSYHHHSHHNFHSHQQNYETNYHYTNSHSTDRFDDYDQQQPNHNHNLAPINQNRPFYHQQQPEWNQWNYGNKSPNNHKNYNYLPPPDKGQYWGLYGGSYGTTSSQNDYNYWGFNKFNHNQKPFNSYLPPSPSQSPPSKPESYLPVSKPGIYDIHGSNGNSNSVDNSLLPAEPRNPYYNFLKDECSLRSATGFRLHKGIVKKVYTVPNIYDCELLCFKERFFPCNSYAYRYTINPTNPSDNCHLSHKNYKELDYYTDLAPDRDFDIYTMNNQERCAQPLLASKDTSECFWRVRSGQRLNHEVVRDSLLVNSIVECQLECLKSVRFTCRAYSYRYGSPSLSGAIDNCQLTDWPYFELDPHHHFDPEYGFEIYERGSFGHGCEPDHFTIRGRHQPDPTIQVDQLCYIGFGAPARLLPQATKKYVWATTELDCKAECSKLRDGTLFQCMSFSYRTDAPRTGPNCLLSDILQRDLISHIDYVADPNSKLFAWDNYSPECTAFITTSFNRPHHEIEHNFDHHNGLDKRIEDDRDFYNALNTWRIYSVSGWPCKRGTLCKENRETGFWYCELEAGERNAWDYCCRPDHQCGASKGYPYQWCYVGPERTQWRKCSDRYYPYIHNIIDRIDYHKYRPVIEETIIPIRDPWYAHLEHNPPHAKPPFTRPGVRPDRPPAPSALPPIRPSLDEYEMQFNNQFLDPPKPGGFGQARHWPVSYLHKEMPPNITDDEPMMTKSSKDPKYAAIQRLIDAIKSKDLENVQYQISNTSNKNNETLIVKIPLPSNFTNENLNTTKTGSTQNSNKESSKTNNTNSSNSSNNNSRRQAKSLPLVVNNVQGVKPTYRRSYIERTNVTNHVRVKDRII